jgi:hypothetical protein
MPDATRSSGGRFGSESLSGVEDSARVHHLSGEKFGPPNPSNCGFLATTRKAAVLWQRRKRIDPPVSFDSSPPGYVPVLSPQACHHRCQWPSLVGLVLLGEGADKLDPAVVFLVVLAEPVVPPLRAISWSAEEGSHCQVDDLSGDNVALHSAQTSSRFSPDSPDRLQPEFKSVLAAGTNTSRRTEIFVIACRVRFQPRVRRDIRIGCPSASFATAMVAFVPLASRLGPSLGVGKDYCSAKRRSLIET